MNFELTPEQEGFKRRRFEFARRKLNSNMIERDAQQVFSHDGWKKWAGFGVQGMPIPREYGGRNADSITAIAIQTHGARGFLTEFELEREMRDR
jgi:alkylation response protein AidB-like acyl-CoA dehydrogenase